MYDRNLSTTICAKCANLIIPDGARNRFYFWQCHAKKWPPVYNPVTGQHDRHPPYHLCVDLNAGDCPLYEPGPNELKPKATPEGEILP